MAKVFDADVNVVEAAKQRIREQLLDGAHMVVSTSGGKDSTVVMELALQVHRELGMLPLKAIMRDEEVMYPGTYEYLARVYERPEIELHWIIAGQPIINAFNRFVPYWWVFDPLEEDKWVRRPPDYAIWIDDQDITRMTTVERFPPPEGMDWRDYKLQQVVGLRADESITRRSRISQTKGALTIHPVPVARAWTFAPIYDFTDKDVWKAIKDFGWDYNVAYNDMYRAGVKMRALRIAPPSMPQGMRTLKFAARIWPDWFDKVETRLPGMRAAAYYGRRAIEPIRRKGESWEEVYKRMILEAQEVEAQWLVDRMAKAMTFAIDRHARHSSEAFPDSRRASCRVCPPVCPGSWERMSKTMWNGDPWATINQTLGNVQPSTFRPGATDWEHKVKLQW